jgi:hypothetical protein
LDLTVEIAGRLEEVDFPEILASIGRGRESGTLVVSQETRKVELFMKEGALTFARSSNPDDSLGVFLFRKGRLSLKLLDEIGGRVTAEKRLGTVLLESNHVGAEELVDLIQEHLLESVYRVFTWETGNYSFRLGAPGIKEVVVLGKDMRFLLLAGMRRIESWNRIRRGLGAFDSCFARSGEASEVLEPLEPAPEERAVMEALRRPVSASAIAEETGLSEFLVCRILWAFKAIGAANPASPARRAEEAGGEKKVSRPAPESRSEPSPIPETEPERSAATGGAAAVRGRDSIGPAIRRFNEKHSYLYQELEAEIGVLVKEYIRKTVKEHLKEREADLFLTTDLDSGGMWDEAGLRKAVAEAGIEDWQAVFDTLIETEKAGLLRLVGHDRGRLLLEELEGLDRNP